MFDKDKLADTMDRLERQEIQRRMVNHRKLVADRIAFGSPDTDGKFASPDRDGGLSDGPLGDDFCWWIDDIFDHLFSLMRHEHTPWCEATMEEIRHRFEIHNNLVGKAQERGMMETERDELKTIDDMINKGIPPF